MSRVLLYHGELQYHAMKYTRSCERSCAPEHGMHGLSVPVSLLDAVERPEIMG